MSFTRVAQLTDIHLLPEKNDRIMGIDPCKSLKSVLRHALSLAIPPELFLATGDLVEDGSSRSYQRLQNIFKSTDKPYFVVPGNHDDKSNMKESLLNESIKMQSATEINSWTIALVNSQVVNQEFGFIDQNELSQLEKTLKTANRKNVLVALHHSPTPECASPGCQLKNGGEFLSLLSEYPSVKAVIAGHTHTCTELEHNNIALLTTPSTFLHASHAKEGESDDPNDFEKSHKLDGNRKGYRVIDLYETGELTSKVFWV